MPLGTATLGSRSGESASQPTFTEILTFAGDDAYPAGGTTGFAAYVAAARSIENFEVLSVVTLNAPANPNYMEYDKANEKLVVYVRATGLQRAAGDDSANSYTVAVTGR